MTKAIMRKESRDGRACLVVDDAEDPKFLARYADGSFVVAELKKVRGAHGLYQLRKWWKLCAILAENMPAFDADARGVSDMLLIACRECDWRVNPRTGDATPVPRSLAIENMEEDVFERLWQRAIFYVHSEWLPIGTEKLKAEIEAFFAGPEERARRESLGRRVIHQLEAA